ncbi:uncharacterized protein EV154DRAFT_534033 [Mucor mucedo]|uniref:uncharacterized protein n=1 Tax=Mucor mucedo TaxID=29922 RepID=UPI00221FAB58|nr:uncharacterized protein EV154DRAFT_534033 [Mucor mucedo]KAI7864384.1 hypothetical protein EV154DRAFT_534033 [Mucor mucedo]
MLKVTQVGKIIDYPCEKPKIDELEGKLLVESSENPVTQVDKIIDDSCEKPMNGELEGELTAELSNKTEDSNFPLHEVTKIDELEGKLLVESFDNPVTPVDKKIESSYSVNTDIKKTVDPFIQTEDSITTLNKELMNVKTEEELSDESSNKTDIGNKSLFGNIGSPNNSVTDKESWKYSSSCDVSQSNDKAELNEVSVDIQKEFNFNIERYKTMNGEWNCTVLSEEIYPKDELITEEDCFKRAQKKNEDKEKENEDIEKEKNKAEELTKESKKTYEELQNLINQADNNLFIPENEKEILTAYSEMKKDIEECLGGQTEDIGNMITIIFSELICCDFTGLDTIGELFESSGHKNWTLQARKQAVCFMIEPQFDNVKTAKTAESVEDNSLKKFNKIIGAFQKKYNRPFLVKNEDKLHDAIKKADLLSKYAVAGEHYSLKEWTYEGLEGLQPKSTESTQVNESINNAPTDKTIKVEAISPVKVSPGKNQNEHQGEHQGENPNESQSETQGEAQKYPSKQLNEDKVVIEVVIEASRKNPVAKHLPGPPPPPHSSATHGGQKRATDNQLMPVDNRGGKEDKSKKKEKSNSVNHKLENYSDNASNQLQKSLSQETSSSGRQKTTGREKGQEKQKGLLGTFKSFFFGNVSQ